MVSLLEQTKNLLKLRGYPGHHHLNTRCPSGDVQVIVSLIKEGWGESKKKPWKYQMPAIIPAVDLFATALVFNKTLCYNAQTMTINSEIEKVGNETSTSMLRRFSRKMQNTGIIKKVKGGRYKARILSKFKVKKRALASIKMRREYDRLFKLGKAPVGKERGKKK